MGGCLPKHGRVACSLCHGDGALEFDRTKSESEDWRITANAMSWGSTDPNVVVLGFSKGPTQAGALARTPHNAVAYKGGRTNLAKILHHVGLLERPDASLVDRLISDEHGQFHFGSLMRCTVERRVRDDEWTGTGGGMLDRFLATGFGATVARNCASKFLANLPSRTKLILMLGMGSKGNYITGCRKLFEAVRPGKWSAFNEVTYSDDCVVVVHTEHFASQGALIPNWLSGDRHKRGRLGLMARQGVLHALTR